MNQFWPIFPAALRLIPATIFLLCSSVACVVGQSANDARPPRLADPPRPPVGLPDPQESGTNPGQADPSANNSGEPDMAEDEEDGREITVGVLPSGRQRQVPGFWTSLAVSGTNRTDEDTEETVIAMIGDETNSQFARRFWVPANARRSGWLLTEVPESIRSDQNSVPLRSIHLMETGRGEEFRTNYLGMPTSKRQMLVSRENMRTGVMLAPAKLQPGKDLLVERLGDFVYLGRDEVEVAAQDFGASHLDVGFLPTTPRVLDPFDQLVIAGDTILSDSVSVDRIRSWLAEGGRLWIMIDRLEPESVRRLLGDALPYSIVDRVELNAYDHQERAVFSGADPSPQPWSSEVSAEMVRVLADVDDVQAEIDGWPTAFWIPVGQGEVLFTTLAPNGWIDEGRPSTVYSSVAKRFFVPRVVPDSQSPEMQAYLDQQIGYSIPSRRSVAGVLGTYVLIVLVVGLLLAQRRALHLLAVVVPVVAVLASSSLVVMGKQRTASIPSTIAIGQVGRAMADSNEVQVHSVAAVFSQDARDLDVRSGYQSATKLKEELSGDVRRVVWDDSGQSQWKFVKQPPGVVRHVSSQSSLQLTSPWSVQGSFTEQGFEGRLRGLDLASCEDPVLVTKAVPSMAADLDRSSGDIRLFGKNVLAADQYIDSALMSDVQQDRQLLMRKLLGSESTLINESPSLLVWSDPVDVDLEFGDDFERRGTLLASIPITFTRQPPGTRFVIPPGFVRLESARSESGFSSVYNERTGQWMGRDSAAEAQVRCIVPQAVFPCQLDALSLDIKMKAPMRTFEIKSKVDGEWITLTSEQDPNGLVSVSVTEPDKLKLDTEGGLLLMISLSDTEEEKKIASGEIVDEGLVISQDEWQIDYMHVTFGGITGSNGAETGND